MICGGAKGAPTRRGRAREGKAARADPGYGVDREALRIVARSRLRRGIIHLIAGAAVVAVVVLVVRAAPVEAVVYRPIYWILPIGIGLIVRGLWLAMARDHELPELPED